MNFRKAWVSVSIRLKRLRNKIRGYIKKKSVYVIAQILNIFSAPKIDIFKDLVANNSDELVINVLGRVKLNSSEEVTTFEEAIASLDSTLSEADLNLVFAKREGAEMRYMQMDAVFKKYRLTNIANFGQDNKLTILESDIGKIGVISFDRYAKLPRGRRLKIELERAVLAIKKQKADYILLYIDYTRGAANKAEERSLHSFLFTLGIDYIVGVKPNLIYQGGTYQRKDRAVSRAVLSVGDLFSEKSKREERVVLKLKLSKENNKLQTYYESYYPYIYDEGHFIDLTKESEDYEFELIRRQSLAKIESGLSRIKAVNRVMTVGKIAELSGVSLPEQYRYLSKFTVGHFSTRSADRIPGDVYMFAQPYPDPNDAAAYDHEKRLEIALRMAQKCLFVFSHKSLPTSAPYMEVEDILEAHTKVTAYVREQVPAKVLAVTGSIGKTSTKTMLYGVMETFYKTKTNSKNENTQLYMSVNVQDIRSDTEIYIQETGGGRTGGASRHSRMINPEVAVITNIGDAHIGNFGTREVLMQNKLQIIDGMPENGVLYLNGDDPLLVTAKPNCKTIYYAVYNKDADYYADDIVETEDGMDFYIVHNGERVMAHVGVPGIHNVLNAVCSFAIGKQYNIPEEKIIEGIAAFKTAGVRQNIVKNCGINFFLDCFNASTGSFDSSLETLHNIPLDQKFKKIALLGDITGQGETAEQTHEEVAEIILKYPVDKYVLFGQDIKRTWEILKGHGIEAFYSDDRNVINEYLRQNVSSGDMLLVKGSSKMELQKCLDIVYGTSFTDEVLINEGKHWVIRAAGIKYNMFSDYSSAVSGESSVKHLKFKRNVGDTKLINVMGSFGSSKLEKLTLHKGIAHLDHEAFKDAVKLKSVKGGQGLKYIGDRAFYKCKSLEHINLPEGLLHIGNGAFAGCTSLKEVTIPKTVEQIGKKVFFNCPNISIYCYKDSYAEKYLLENELIFSYK